MFINISLILFFCTVQIPLHCKFSDFNAAFTHAGLTTRHRTESFWKSTF